MSAEFRREYLLRLPLPLAQLYSRAYNAKDARGRHDNAFYLCEALVKLAAAPLIACYLDEAEQGAPRSEALDRLLAQLALPSLGQWLAMLRELARHFGGRPDAAAHPLGQVWGRINGSRTDLPGLLALYRRIKNGVDGAAAGDQSCSPLQAFDALVQYRNGVFGHGGPRFPSFYEREMGPLLFPAVNDLLAEGTLDVLGPRGGRLVQLTELRTLEDGRVEVGLRELTGLQGERLPPLTLTAEQAAALAPGRTAVLWPGRPLPLRLDPLLTYREGELSEEVLFFNRDRNSKQVEYLSYTTGRTERDKAMAPALAALLSRVVGRAVGEDQLRALAEQSAAETPSVEALFADAAPAAQTVGDYEVLGELGRGGMGVVYLARQTSLGRLVALKMLPADLAGDEVALARFRREVRALARCDHPHIVKVLASGALPDGRLYYAMEYVPGCDLEQVWRELSGPAAKGGASDLGGATLARAVRSASQKARDQAVSRAGRPSAPGGEPIAAAPLPPLPEPPPLPDDPGGYARRVAALVRDAALALQAVHDQGLVHRDVKPSNLMLTADGSRLVLMDFGLAKGQSLTLSASRSGGLLGTLRYAAPEQLAAANMKVGPAADVRGLGVTLWEMLTRRRLFAEAEDEGALTALVLAGDVPRLRRVDPSLDRDLEAIVARATERAAADRIPTAGRLAEYLQLYLEGKPLPIRPPGAVERAGRWVRRQPALAALAALFVLSLLAGTGVSTYFAFDSHANYVQARAWATDLRTEKAKLEESLAKSLLRPVGHEARPPRILDPEIDALWELAGSSDRVRVLFVGQALRRPLTARQLRNRADLAMHAAVGLGPERRRQAEQALLAALNDPAADPDVRADCVVIGLALDDSEPPFAEAASRQAVEALGRTDDPIQLCLLADALAAYAPRLPRVDAARRAGAGVASLVRALDAPPKLAPEAPDERAKDEGNACLGLVRFLGPDEAAAVGRQVADAVGAENGETPVLIAKARLLTALANRLGPETAATAARKLVTAKESGSDDLFYDTDVLAALAALAPHLGPKQAAGAAAQIIRNMRVQLIRNMRVGPDVDRYRYYSLWSQAEAWASLAPRLYPEEAAAQTEEVKGLILNATRDRDADPANAALALAALAPRLGPFEASLRALPTAERLVGAAGANDNARLSRVKAAALARLAPFLAPEDATRLAEEAGRRIVTDMDHDVANHLAPHEFRDSTEVLAVLAPWQRPDEAKRQAAEAAGLVLEGMDGSRNWDSEPALPPLVPYLEPDEARRQASKAARILMAADDQARVPPDQWDLFGKSLAAVAPLLGPEDASRTAALVVRDLQEQKNNSPLTIWDGQVAALAALAPRIGRSDAAEDAGLIVELMGKTNHPYALQPLPFALAALLVQSAPRESDRRVRSLAAAIGNASGAFTLFTDLAPTDEAWQPLSGRLNEQQLVDLLKALTCRREARQVIVARLGNQCGRPFADMWEFVEWAKENRPDLDLTSPPARPDGP